MKKKNGFIATSLIYTFFLVFAMLSILLLANYTHNRLLLRTFNTEIKGDLDTRGGSKLANFKNILNNTEFEIANDSWVVTGNAAYPTKGYVQNGLEFQHDTENLTAFDDNGSVTQNISRDLKPGHKYYLRMAVWNGQISLSDNNYVRLYNTVTNTIVPFNNLNLSELYSDWTVIGQIIVLPEGVSEQNWQLQIGIVRLSNGFLRIDEIILMDVTNACGEGELTPSLEWLNNQSNLPFFEDKYIINKYDYSYSVDNAIYS